jgi:hypothetical protein
MKIINRENRKPRKDSRRKPYVYKLTAATNPTQCFQHWKTATQHPTFSLRTSLLHNEPTANDTASSRSRYINSVGDDSAKYGNISEMKRKNKKLQLSL